LNLSFPAEWAQHRSIWLGFPSHPELWEDNLVPAQAEVAALARALAGPGGERVRLLVRGEAAEAQARALLGATSGIEIVRGLFGDIWLRDTGPIFVTRGDEVVASAFRFNGWGEKYVLEDDDTVAEQLAAAAGAPRRDFDMVLEGGAIDTDGFGTLLTTAQCLQNPNRNPGWTAQSAQDALSQALGTAKILWLGEGLVNDHTDGHVDNLARFVAPGVVACPVAFGRDDPNMNVFADAARRLAAMTDARGVPLHVVRIPSPGLIPDADGRPTAASHMNFIIANDAVIMPVYEDPEREVIGLPSRAILTGGGSFHCITQQEPA